MKHSSITRRNALKLAAGSVAMALTQRSAHALPPSGVMQFVGTRAFDNARTGWNQHETVLTQASVRARGVRSFFTLPMEGDARGTEGQPLFMPSVQMPDGTVRDVVIIASMNNTVWAYDANTSDDLWMVKLGIPVNGGASIDWHRINDHWGILSTGVIDRDTGVYYCVAWTSPDGTPAKGSHAVYALNVASGQLARPTCPLKGATYQPSHGPVQRWDGAMRKQRSSLCLTNVGGVKTIFFASGTVLETVGGAAGWVHAYDVATAKLAASWAATEGYGAGIWMGGQGLAADADGYLYFMTGNGSFDPANADYGECFLKLEYTPASSTGAAAFSVVDWWSPYTDAGRLGEGVTGLRPRAMAAMKVAGVNGPTQMGNMPTVKPVNGGMEMKASTAANNRNYADEDLGSGGVTLFAGPRLMLGGGKDGILYPVSMDQLGHTMPADFADGKRNYAKLRQPPLWASYFPGFNVDPAPQDPTTLNFLFDGKTRHLHSTPVQYRSPVHGLMVFVWGENSNLRAWAVDEATGTITYLAQGEEVASTQVTWTPGGMPGGFMCASSNGSTPGTGLLWATIPYGDANAQVTNGRLLCYDPDNFKTYPDGSKGLQVLWDSQAQGIQFVFNKFDGPLINGGKVWLPCYNNETLTLG